MTIMGLYDVFVILCGVLIVGSSINMVIMDIKDAKKPKWHWVPVWSEDGKLLGLRAEEDTAE